MNNARRMVVGFTAAIVVLMLIAPPYRGHGFDSLFYPPVDYPDIDFTRLIIQLLVVGVVSGVSYVSCARSTTLRGG